MWVKKYINHIFILIDRILPWNLIKSYFKIFYIFDKNGIKERTWFEIIVLAALLPVIIIYTPKLNITRLISSLDSFLSIGLPVFTALYISFLLLLRDRYIEIKDVVNQSITPYDKELMSISGMGILFAIIATILFYNVKYGFIGIVNNIVPPNHHYSVLTIEIGIILYCLIMFVHCLLITLKRVFRDF